MDNVFSLRIWTNENHHAAALMVSRYKESTSEGDPTIYTISDKAILTSLICLNTTVVTVRTGQLWL